MHGIIQLFRSIDALVGLGRPILFLRVRTIVRRDYSRFLLVQSFAHHVPRDAA